ncbi:MAG TPA: helicase-associated domain-containing protein [Candidatus Wallbacteria bacterium]|nr:MAG: Type III restriction enzyme, res subunit [bacterium ADurb.Bin243]HOD40470.1 helicase-associated domain-containing protein [Candidatus Wallbacteria bacterium]HPG57886.1 helicase-associated domain-containing protein [Candidatus Wallbacteria bacterium]
MLENCADGPIIVQSDLSVLADASHPRFEECRAKISVFAELVKSPEYMHTYRITPVSLWNAGALGADAEGIIATLKAYSRFGISETVIHEINYYCSRYGVLTLECAAQRGFLKLNSKDRFIIMELCGNNAFAALIHKKIDEFNLLIKAEMRGELKRALIKINYPVRDMAGYIEGTPFEVNLRSRSAVSGAPFALRDYQAAACDAFHKSGGAEGGSGVVVLACGAGKTCVGMGAMAKVNSNTLIITTNTVAVRQWISELKDKTEIDENDIGEYSGEKKQIRPVTVTTYQILMWHRGNDDHYPHFCVLTDNEWGLVIYDEVHLLPAPIFRVTAQIQARRRLGLTATLVREDRLECDVFSLIGPKVYELPWKSLEKKGHIARANCYEVRVKMSDALKYDYAVAKKACKHRICAVNPLKMDVILKIIESHPGEPVLIIGQYLDQIGTVSKMLGAPLITGQTPSSEREELYARFKTGGLGALVVSKVANFAIDLPDASCAIQISGSYGSRQEEAQRLGRVLRPKKDGREAHFYTVVTADSLEADFSMHRQLYLSEQGYKYYILDAEEFLRRKRITAETAASILKC